MKYESYQYLYPPRPTNAIPPKYLDDWDNGTMIAQPKLNGSNCLIFTDGTRVVAMNRHAQRLSGFRIQDCEILSSIRGKSTGWTVLNGEYLNKSKQDDTGSVLSHKLVIFDILVRDSEYLVGTTFAERITLMDSMFGQDPSHKHYMTSVSENILRVRSYRDGFSELFTNLTTRGDLIEGIVLKRSSAKLEVGITENNNTRSQVKCRVPTKNYRF
jgi:hypothetical protein